MSTGREARVVVIGVGNPLRGDDAAGRAVVRALEATCRDGLELLERDGDPTGLMQAWEGAGAAFVIDAVRTGAAPGTVHRFDAAAGPLPARLGGGASTHGLGVGDAIELARELGRLPAKLVLYGIEAGDLELGSRPAPAVERAIEVVAERVAREALA